MASVSLNLSIWEKSYSIENNTSEIGWSLSVTSSNAYNGYDNQCPYVVKYNNSSGSTVASGNKGFNNNTTTQLASGTISGYKHNSDGSASITLYAHYTTGVSPATASVSTTIKLTTIPRESSIAVSNYNLGQNISITIGKKVSTFTSTLTYKIGSRTGTIATKTSNTPFVWEMPEELISQIKQDNSNNSKPNATIYCDTYNGNTKIGNTRSATFTLYITDKPTIDNIEIEETIELIKQYTTSIVKYLSVPQFYISTTSSEGTYISKYIIKIGDREINSVSANVTVNNIQYSYLTEEGIRKTKFVVICTDARGNSSEEYPLEIDFIEYVKLAFNNTDITFTRLNVTSNFIKLHMTGYVYNGIIGETQNTLIIRYRYKLRNDLTAEWSELKVIEAILNEDNIFIVDNLQLEDEFDYRKNYDIEFYAQDLFLTEKYSNVIKTSETIVKWHKGGLDAKNLTIGKKQVVYRGIEEIYSTEEQIVGVWIDGRPIYKKVLEIGSINGTNMKTIEVPSNIDKLIKEPEGMLYDNDANGFPLNYNNIWNLNQDIGSFYYSKYGIQIKCYADFGIKEGYITIEYVKITDIVEEVNHVF